MVPITPSLANLSLYPAMALDPSRGGTLPFQCQVEKSCDVEGRTKSSGTTTAESLQTSYSGSFPSLTAPLSSDQQYIRSVSHVGFTKALLAQKPSPWTKPMFKLYYFLFVAFLSSAINGYDSSLMAGINAMKEYQGYVHCSCIGRWGRDFFLIPWLLNSDISTWKLLGLVLDWSS